MNQNKKSETAAAEKKSAGTTMKIKKPVKRIRDIDNMFYRIKGTTKKLVPVKPRKTIKKKYYGRKIASTRKFVVQRKLRKSIEVGKIAIILAGKHMGKRCIITKILPSGLVVVTGPYAINGVPIKRIDPRYLIVTSTNIFSIDNMGRLKENFVTKAEQIDDSLFLKPKEIKARQKKLLKKKEEGEEEENQSLFMNGFLDALHEIRKTDPKMQKIEEIQRDIGNLLKPDIEKNEVIKAYLKTKFTLRNDMIFHKMKF